VDTPKKRSETSPPRQPPENPVKLPTLQNVLATTIQATQNKALESKKINFLILQISFDELTTIKKGREIANKEEQRNRRRTQSQHSV
jgi:hypothetical protein